MNINQYNRNDIIPTGKMAIDKMVAQLEEANRYNQELQKQNDELNKSIQSLKPNDKKAFWLGLLSGIISGLIVGIVLALLFTQ